MNNSKINYASRLMQPSFRAMPNTNGWQDRHRQALITPQGSEEPLVRMLHGWARYADQHRFRYESGIGDDGVLGPQWATIGAALRSLLNGECGRLDCGTLDGFLNATLTDEGFNPESL